MLVKSTKMQLDLIIHKKGFQISFLIVLGYVILNYLYYVFTLWGYNSSDLYNPAVLNALNSDSKFSWYFITYYPFLVVLPAGFIFMTDKEINIIPIVQSRQSVQNYYLSKIIAAFISGFIVFSIPFLFNLLINVLTFPLDASGTLTNFPTYSDTYFEYASCYLFSNLYHSHIYLYYILTILIFGCFSGIVSMFLVAISTFKLKYKIFMFLPFYLITYFIRLIGNNLDLSLDFNYGDYLMASDIASNKNILFLISLILILLISIFLITLYNIKHEKILLY
jgi:hypothetical protein